MRSRFMTPFGPIGLDCGVAGELVRVDLTPTSAHGPADDPPPSIATQLAAYFSDPAFAFAIPLTMVGTVFQRRVWDALRAIPPGCTTTYGELARALATAPRAIGLACRANPCPIVVPCHRVVAVRGLGGFGGATGGRRLAIKRWLLAHEGVEIAS
jgi:methylated-DNA-[protein]-cysteine S-methyltransferase